MAHHGTFSHQIDILAAHIYESISAVVYVHPLHLHVVTNYPQIDILTGNLMVNIISTDGI